MNSNDGREDPARAVQDEIAGLRRDRLGGRGPGASVQETAPYMHDRPTLGAEPTVIERELVHIRTGIARGDAEMIEQDLASARANLASTFDELATRLTPRRLAGGAVEVARARCELLLGSLLGAPALDQQAGDARGGHPGAPPQGRPGVGAVEDWWWRVAARSAALGVAATLGLGLLARTWHRRRA